LIFHGRDYIQRLAFMDYIHTKVIVNKRTEFCNFFNTTGPTQVHNLLVLVSEKAMKLKLIYAHILNLVLIKNLFCFTGWELGSQWQSFIKNKQQKVCALERSSLCLQEQHTAFYACY
jgi:hypothetical protein